MTGNPTLDQLLLSSLADPCDYHLSALLDYLHQCQPDHAIALLRLLIHDSIDLNHATKLLTSANRKLKLTRQGDPIYDALPILILEAKEADRLRQAVVNLTGEGSEGANT